GGLSVGHPYPTQASRDHGFRDKGVLALLALRPEGGSLLDGGGFLPLKRSLHPGLELAASIRGPGIELVHGLGEVRAFGSEPDLASLLGLIEVPGLATNEAQNRFFLDTTQLLAGGAETPRGRVEVVLTLDGQPLLIGEGPAVRVPLRATGPLPRRPRAARDGLVHLDDLPDSGPLHLLLVRRGEAPRRARIGTWTKVRLLDLADVDRVSETITLGPDGRARIGTRSPGPIP
ncbi:MAG: hypothetical protein MI919_11130, partial [Holophagales bacterium]|nr:hypothetical protein [Holophagales bacterium]